MLLMFHPSLRRVSERAIEHRVISAFEEDERASERMIVRGAVPSRGRAARRIAADALLHSSRRTDGPPDRVADMRSANWSSSRFLPALLSSRWHSL